MIVYVGETIKSILMRMLYPQQHQIAASEANVPSNEVSSNETIDDFTDDGLDDLVRLGTEIITQSMAGNKMEQVDNVNKFMSNLNELLAGKMKSS